MKNKQYKPGQLVTIEGKIYRIKKRNKYLSTCIECSMPRYGVFRSKVCDFCIKIPSYCYLKPVKPKQK